MSSSKVSEGLTSSRKAPELAKSSTKQKFGARVKAKVAEAVNKSRQKRLTKLKGKLGQMKMGGSKKSY
jgi:hypothetical protein